MIGMEIHSLNERAKLREAARRLLLEQDGYVDIYTLLDVAVSYVSPRIKISRRQLFESVVESMGSELEFKIVNGEELVRLRYEDPVDQLRCLLATATPEQRREMRTLLD